MSPRILPADLIQQVERYVDSELASVEQYSNRELLDESGVWSLHQLAAAIYAAGWEAGERAEGERSNAQRRRDRSGVSA